MRHLGKSRDGLYEPVLAESEREAVADLLQYLENVGIHQPKLYNYMPNYYMVARRDGLLFWRAPAGIEHLGVFR
jgi:hypothetical protein